MNRLSLLTFLLLLSPAMSAAQSTDAFDGAAAEASSAAVARGANFLGFAERFNRYYTDPAWRPLKTIFVSPNGTGNGQTRATPMSVPAAINAATAGTKIHFIRGTYPACYNFPEAKSGTYAQPIVLYAERNENQTIGGVTTNCCNSGRATCFNLEAADYIAIDGFTMVGGNYGVRAVGNGYAASQHQRGIAVLNSRGRNQVRDPFFSGQSDWAVWEKNVGSNAGDGDGHGIYISNGSDWNIVRLNETFSNASSDFQVNADPFTTCADEGIPFTDSRCSGFAGTGEGGRGASDYFLVDSNFFHHSEIGANFTSVRRSVVRNNVFGLSTRHNASFWQETDNPLLGSRGNKIINNLFVTTERHAVQFVEDSTGNQFLNNVLVGVTINGAQVTANPSAVLMEVDNTVGGNTYRANMYISGKLEGRTHNAQEFRRTAFSKAWFRKFPTALNRNPNDFSPTTTAPFLEKGPLSVDAPLDRNGIARSPGPVDLGPIELR